MSNTSEIDTDLEASLDAINPDYSNPKGIKDSTILDIARYEVHPDMWHSCGVDTTEKHYAVVDAAMSSLRQLGLEPFRIEAVRALLIDGVDRKHRK